MGVDWNTGRICVSFCRKVRCFFGFLRFLINNLINNKMDTEPLFGAVQSWVRQERGGLSYGFATIAAV